MSMIYYSRILHNRKVNAERERVALEDRRWHAFAKRDQNLSGRMRLLESTQTQLMSTLYSCYFNALEALEGKPVWCRNCSSKGIHIVSRIEREVDNGEYRLNAESPPHERIIDREQLDLDEHDMMDW